MSGPCSYLPAPGAGGGTPRRLCRGAALTLVFAGVLATGAATGSWGDAPHREPEAAAPVPAAPVADAADTREAAAVAAVAAAVQEGQSGAAAREAVSRSGDRWSAVYSAREYEGFRQRLDGRYVGVGLAARRARSGQLEVDRVEAGSPAARAGIRPGDRLRTVNGTPTAGRPVTEVVAELRGDHLGDRAEDTPVVLGLQRGTRRWERTLRRARLRTRPVTVDRLTDRRPPATRIRVQSFTKGTGEEVRRAVRRTPDGDGILLDLRGNSGGLVTEATSAASAFLDGGLVGTYDDRGEQRVLDADTGGDTDTPVVVLVDGGTMSAAELLTGALQDRGRAVVVGSRTFGKGSVQVPRELPDGSVAELTVGHYRTPSGRNVDGAGIVPDLNTGGDTGQAAEERARKVLSGLGGGS